MKIITYNVNGIRSAIRDGFIDWLAREKPDVACLQEIKGQPDPEAERLLQVAGYYSHYHQATSKKGYSGVAILCRSKPDNIVVGCNNSIYDCEGRVLRADFGDTTVLSTYFPSGTTGDVRQEYKYEFLDYFTEYTDDLLSEREKVVICGDINICHQPIDIHDPVRNKKSSGFLPEEREWMSQFLEDNKLTDSFRHLYPERVKYSWWSYRSNAKKNNKGWRIDYCLVSDALVNQIEEVDMLTELAYSDHCPVMLELKP